uniref:Uncharacterized protein n=1 Tax=viral metagenome TaxID=1070528 RepID=A0A6C0E1W2_9ZZZZ
MGCDFYIYVYLEIQHVNGISYYELPTIRGYYCDLECGVCDSDDDENDYYYNSTEYKTLYENMKKICLTSRKPLVIYTNNSFMSPKLEMKYSPIIQNKINKKYVEKYTRYKETGTFKSMEEIIHIVKKEERYAV